MHLLCSLQAKPKVSILRIYGPLRDTIGLNRTPTVVVLIKTVNEVLAIL
jgi:hypothetical protein